MLLAALCHTRCSGKDGARHSPAGQRRHVEPKRGWEANIRLEEGREGMGCISQVRNMCSGELCLGFQHLLFFFPLFCQCMRGCAIFCKNKRPTCLQVGLCEAAGLM